MAHLSRWIKVRPGTLLRFFRGDTLAPRSSRGWPSMVGVRLSDGPPRPDPQESLPPAPCTDSAKHTFQPDLIIFDKDGTLVSFHDQWSPWIQAFTEGLEKRTGLQLREAIFECLDFCVFTSKTRSGLLGHGTTWQIKREVEDLLTNSGLQRPQAQLAVEACWETCVTEQQTVKTLAPLSKLFTQLQSEGVKIAICTSDSRSNTEWAVSKLGLHGMVDMMVCGDDKDSLPKPHPHNTQHICDTLGVSPHKTVLIGDTRVDMEMGQSAGLGLVLGVLSGIGTRLDLTPYAHHVVGDVAEAVGLARTLPVTETGAGTEAGDLREGKRGGVRMSDGRKASLVIFDKDGTLLCFNALWTPWVQRMIRRLEKQTGLSLRRHVFAELGYCHDTESWRSGLFAEGTSAQNRSKVKEILMQEGLDKFEAEDHLRKAWDPGDQSMETDNLKVLDNPHLLFRTLKENGIKVAICTADSRLSTEQFVRELGVSDHVDIMVCGDDDGAVPKPAPGNAMAICRQLGVDPAEVLVVGDTTADLGMGRSARLGATVGVLSGVGRVSELDPHADHVVPSIKHVLSIVLPEDHPDVQKVLKD